jgi:hypothetical protein
VESLPGLPGQLGTDQLEGGTHLSAYRLSD